MDFTMNLRSLLRTGTLAVLLASTGQAFAQREPMVLYNFTDIPVTVTATKERVKEVIVRAALTQSWDIVEQPDGSLLATWSRQDDYGMKVKITYDATKYSVAYVESHGLRARTAQEMMRFSEETIESARVVQEKRFKDWPDTPYRVKTDLYIHLNYEDDVRTLLANIRRRLLAPVL
jgi:hypothetical protein